MAEVDLDRYLQRIGYQTTPTPDLPTLAALQHAHLETVPFENLDIFYGPGVPLDEAAAVHKVVERGRGGWCFELNSAFAGLLEAVGFDVTRSAAEVLLDGDPPETPDHLTLIVDLGGARRLVDVGFGDAFRQPLDLDSREPQNDPSRRYRIVEESDLLVLEAERDGAWVRQFRFRPEDAEFADFQAASERLQTTPGLRWSALRFATRIYPGGRVTLLHDRLKFEGTTSTEERVTETEWHEELDRWFGITGLPHLQD